MKIEIELSEEQIFSIKTVFDRLLFDHYLACTDSDRDPDQAYRLQAAMTALFKQIIES